jgi:hypothetical protein
VLFRSLWVPAAVQPHGMVKLNVQLSQSAQTQLNLPHVKLSTTSVQALADSGAQMCVADWDVAARLNLTKADLLHPALKVSVADNSNLELVGAHFLSIYSDSGESTEQMVYFAHNVGDFYLSKAAMIDLGIISKDFPTVGSSHTQQGALNQVQDELTSAHQPSPQHHGPGSAPPCPRG